MAQRVSDKKMAELIVDARSRHGIVSQQRQPEEHRQKSQQGHRETLACGQLADELLTLGSKQEKSREQACKRQFDYIADAKAERVVRRQEGMSGLQQRQSVVATSSILTFSTSSRFHRSANLIPKCPGEFVSSSSILDRYSRPPSPPWRLVNCPNRSSWSALSSTSFATIT